MGRVVEVKFEYRAESRLIAFSFNSGPSRFHRGEHLQQFLNQVFKLKYEALQ